MEDGFDIGFLSSIKGELLDRFLVRGWYRMGANIFTTHSLQPAGHDMAYPVFWLRYNVARVQLSKSSRAIIKLNKGFSARVRPFSLTSELRELHRKYFDSIDFLAGESIEQVLDDVHRVVYDTWVIEVLDGERLIAAGIFDRGQHTIMGIINFYDPEYKKYSLGKLLVVLKYNYCRTMKIPWYYPGYFSPTYPKFDYKLFLDKNATEVYIREMEGWIGYNDFLSRQ